MTLQANNGVVYDINLPHREDLMDSRGRDRDRYTSRRS